MMYFLLELQRLEFRTFNAKTLCLLMNVCFCSTHATLLCAHQADATWEELIQFPTLYNRESSEALHYACQMQGKTLSCPCAYQELRQELILWFQFRKIIVTACKPIWKQERLLEFAMKFTAFISAISSGARHSLLQESLFQKYLKPS